MIVYASLSEFLALKLECLFYVKIILSTTKWPNVVATKAKGLFTFEIDFSAEIIVENVDDSFDERILFQFRNGQKFADAHRSGPILERFGNPDEW